MGLWHSKVVYNREGIFCKVRTLHGLFTCATYHMHMCGTGAIWLYMTASTLAVQTQTLGLGVRRKTGSNKPPVWATPKTSDLLAWSLVVAYIGEVEQENKTSSAATGFSPAQS